MCYPEKRSGASIIWKTLIPLQKTYIMKSLPIGIQSFRDLRTKGYLYVDKTSYILQMMEGKNYFLSRPRRFGKSLLLSTIEEIFLGNKGLFEGLYIENKIAWDKHPVLRLDFGGRGYDTPEALVNTLNGFVDENIQKHDVTVDSKELPDRFRMLITKIHEKYGKQLVILIDEYDKPIVDHLHNLPVASANRDILRSFYQVMKATDEHQRFIFLTGVSKFAKVSVFSGLNNLNDITLDPRYSAICGYTQDELEDSFAAHIADYSTKAGIEPARLLKQIKEWYNGYSWDGATTVYNPFSTLLLFAQQTFGSFWFATGTPGFLIRMLKDTDLSPVLEPVTMTSSGFDSFDPDSVNILPLMFQTGYLTVKSVRNSLVAERPVYTLGIPNREVHDSLMSGLLAEYSGFSAMQTDAMKITMQEQLVEGDEAGFSRSLKQMFAHIPYQLHIDREAYYHSLVLLWVKLMGFQVQGEVSTNTGRVDAVWQWKNYVVIAEVKYLPEEKTDDDSITKLLAGAMKQIKVKRYYDRYNNGQHILTLLAIAFAGKKVGCCMERLPFLPTG